MIKLITLDLDNTLWDSTPVLRQAEKAMAAWLKDNEPEALRCLKSRNWIDFKEELIAQNPSLKNRLSLLRLVALKRVMEEAGLSEGLAEQRAQVAFNVFLAARQNVTLFDQAIPLLEMLISRYSIVSITNGNANLETIGLDHYFQHMVSADSYGIAKPEPEIFQHALSLAGVSPEETVHIGDHLEDDVSGAMAAGIHAIWFNPHQQSPVIPVRWQVANLMEIESVLDEIEGVFGETENSI